MSVSNFIVFPTTDNAAANAADPLSAAKPVSSVGGGSGGIRVHHVVITAILSFALGGLVSVGLFLYCQRWRRAKKAHGGGSNSGSTSEKYATLTKHQVQTNDKVHTHKNKVKKVNVLNVRERIANSNTSLIH